MAVPEGSPVYEPGLRWSEVDRFGPTGGSYGTPVAEGAGFAYDEATLHELVTEWTDLSREYRNDLHEAQVIAVAQPPGLEYASGDNAEITRKSGEALVQALTERIAYCEKMATKYVTALGKYATAEEQAKITIDQQSESIV
ncbi:hypothetical protein [Amycolatopsis japonica]|uniref:hypothetical protein n=1 Tax=Amycolatopsis japonica TaxID=208439 RepID=UPI00340059D0